MCCNPIRSLLLLSIYHLLRIVVQSNDLLKCVLKTLNELLRNVIVLVLLGVHHRLFVVHVVLRALHVVAKTRRFMLLILSRVLSLWTIVCNVKRCCKTFEVCIDHKWMPHRSLIVFKPQYVLTLCGVLTPNTFVNTTVCCVFLQGGLTCKTVQTVVTVKPLALLLCSLCVKQSTHTFNNGVVRLQVVINTILN